MAFDPLSGVLDLGGKLIDRLFPDPAKKAEASLALLKLQQEGALAEMVAQTNINLEEAKNPKLFVSGWRPFVGWVCGSGLAIQFVARPFAVWGSTLLGHPTDFPTLDASTLLTCLGGLLGLGGLRTYEKINGVAAK